MNHHDVTNPVSKDSTRHLLIAVNDSDNSRRTVVFLADFFGGDRTLMITVLCLIPEPSEDYFANDDERLKWIATKEEQMQEKLAEYKAMLLVAGFQESQIEILLKTQQCDSIGDAILEEQRKLKCGLLMLGRRGMSHNEEFIFGSTSSTILHHAKDCAVLVVE